MIEIDLYMYFPWNYKVLKMFDTLAESRWAVLIGPSIPARKINHATGTEKRLLFWCAFFWNYGQRWDFKASLNCDRADEFDRSARSLA
jgi:hypothetical protein